MKKHYAYRMDHDTGFAPNTDFGLCSLGGCKKTTIEKWADKDSWIIGVGGNNTGKPNKLIYAMEVSECLSAQEFRRKYPRKSRYLERASIDRVLVSECYYYFGNNAIDLPEGLETVEIYTQGCKRVSEEDLSLLRKYLAPYNFGVFGKPNNMCPVFPRTKCQCSSKTSIKEYNDE